MSRLLVFLLATFSVITIFHKHVCADVTGPEGEDRLEVLEKGKPAPDFTLRDINGQKVTLSQFKGKVVYMDVWASWCGPCIAQFGKAAALKEHFKNVDDVVFLYLSIDKNEEKWKDMVEKKKVSGVHLISHGGEEENIINRYNIPSIPRFILIDKSGNIADSHAKSPGSAGIVEDIKNLL